MLKLASLRNLIAQCVPDLARDPERLIVTGDNGALVATGTASLSFEYRYTAYITVLDYAGHADALMVPVLAWLKRNQPELLDNPQRRESAIRFAVNPLTAGGCDIGLEIDLTERALVKPAPSHPTRLTVSHPPEPGLVGEARFDGADITQAEHWELWFDGKQLAAWDLLPAEYKTMFGL